MKPSGILTALTLLVQMRRSVFLWGAPGVGKSNIVYQLGQLLNLPIKEVRALLHDNVDFKGLPFLFDGQTKWAIPDFLPREGEGILFLDELNAAPALVQAACYQLVLDRRLGDYVLPDGWAVIAAGNRESDRSVVTRMPTALRNRFVHLEFQVDRTEWQQWALSNDIAFEVIAFLSLREDLLHKFDKDQNAFPTPRSWSFVSDIVKRNPPPQIEVELIAGAVGRAAATEFAAFLNTSRDFPDIEDILRNPRSEKIPAKADGQYAVACALSRRATDVNFANVCAYLDRMPREFSVLCVTQAARTTPSIQKTGAYTRWIHDHHNILN